MTVKIKNFSPKGEIKIPPSKSHVHRLLILSALSNGQTVVKNVGSSDDVKRTIDSLNKIGAKITVKENDAIVVGIERPNEKATLDCGESGSTLRFMMPIVSALGIDATFLGKGKLLERPNEKLFEVLRKHGIKIVGFNLKGKLSGGCFQIDASISSQYVTGLLIASVLTGEDCEIVLSGKVVSKSYIDITLKALSDFKIKFDVEENKIFIKGGQKFISPKEISSEGDWSSCAFPLVLGALGGDVKVTGVDFNSFQGDKIIVDVLKNAGCNLTKGDGFVRAMKGQLKPIDFDIENCPDTAPIISVLCAFILGKSVLRNVERLKVKESNRLEAIQENLKRAKITSKVIGKDLFIDGGNPKAGEFLGYNDHRIVMAFTVLSALVEGESKVSDKEAVKKSYPEFFEQLALIGGENHVFV